MSRYVAEIVECVLDLLCAITNHAGACWVLRHTQRLWTWAVDTRYGHNCAVGAWAFHKRVAAGESPEEALEALANAGELDGEPYDTCAEGQRQGVAWSMAWELASHNDYARLTPEERYTEYLAWVESQIVGQP